MAELGYLPKNIVAGESIWISAQNTLQGAVDISIPNYTSAAGYTLAYQFAADTPITVNAVASGTSWTLDVTAAQTLLWTAGDVRFAGLATKTASGRVFTVDEGVIAVSASPLTLSQYAAALTAIEAAILAHASNPVDSFTIDGMSINYNSVAELIKLRNYYKALVQRETGKRPRRVIRTRFV